MLPQSSSWPRRVAIAGALGTALVGLIARASAEPGTTLTIYRPAGQAAPAAYGGVGYGGVQVSSPAATGGHAVVALRTHFELPASESRISLPGVAIDVDPATVQWRSLTDPTGTSVIEQRFRYDLGSPDAVLARSLGREVVVATATGEVAGQLVSFDATRLVVETGDARFPVRVIERQGNVRDVRLAAAAGELVTVPTLSWRVRTARPGRHDAEVSYRTGALAWSADYTAIVDASSNAVELAGWVSLANHTGIEFTDARVVLVAGGEAAAGPPSVGGYVGAPAAVSPPQVVSLERPVTLPKAGSVQLELFAPVAGARSRELVVYEPLPNTAYYASGYPNTDCYSYQYQPVRTQGDRVLEVAARQGAMPDGRVRVLQRARTGALSLIGEDQIAPDRGGAIRVRIGTTDAIKGERRQLECRPDPGGHALTEKIEVKVSNAGGKPSRVVVREYLQRWSNWAVAGESVKGVRAGSAAQEFTLDVPAGTTRAVTYAVTYTW